MEYITLRDLSVLLIEPSSVQLGIIKQKLQDEGISQVDTASDMHSALQKISTYPPDLIFSNLHYPDATAVELLTKIRQQEQFVDLPFVRISSENRRQHLEIFKQSGVIAILSKPFSQSDLKKAINATLCFINRAELTLENYDIETLKVIVVDDSRLARKAISRVLRNLGIELLTEFDDGSRAIEYLRNHEVDLVVTDYNMPQVDGAELTKFIRQSEQHQHVPVLMVTSEARDSHIQFVSEAGVSAISDKPFDAQAVKNLLVNILDN
jgi:two-component system chemotaxis response regulator CheY